MGLALGFLLFPVYMFASIFLMGLWGLIGPASASLGMSIALLLFVEFIFLYVLLIRATWVTRLCAHAGFFSPWILILYIVLPQDDDPTPIIVAAIVVAFFALPGEMFVEWIKKKV
jgi:hypothetical protein